MVEGVDEEGLNRRGHRWHRYEALAIGIRSPISEIGAIHEIGGSDRFVSASSYLQLQCHRFQSRKVN